VFFVNVPIVVTALIAGWFLVPDSRDPSAPRLDPFGALLSIAGLASVLWAVIEAPTRGWGSQTILTAFVVGFAILGAFVWWELHYSSPMLDMRFFKNPRFTAASGAVALTFFSLFGSLFLLTQYLQSVHGFTPLQAGALVLPQAAAMMVIAPLSTGIVERFGNKLVVGFGLLLIGMSLASFALLSADAPVWEIVAVTILMGVGMGNVMAPATDSIMGSLPRAKAGVGSAMNDTTRQTGGAVGVAVLGSILASRFRTNMASAGHVHRLPDQITAAARVDIGTALRTAHSSVGARYAGTITAIARHAFVTSFHVASLVGAAVILLAAAGVFKWLPARARDEREALEPAGAVSPVDGLPAGIAPVLEPAFDV
jgi:EmrB/QacA subfamily drug resistance transporter